ncbi:hypothetical protein EJ08DRAFT_702976 [Tothia fuscella]|uniref:Uncharacterized protein n=1 Tax=Tothia fuscella TaxID=1048955 RepID=A0A9P4TSY8_9PEZI|nr:hypothetical protein EJ08DRAFT_702976 [Tothia fuscella]
MGQSIGRAIGWVDPDQDHSHILASEVSATPASTPAQYLQHRDFTTIHHNVTVRYGDFYATATTVNGNVTVHQGNFSGAGLTIRGDVRVVKGNFNANGCTVCGNVLVQIGNFRGNGCTVTGNTIIGAGNFTGNGCTINGNVTIGSAIKGDIIIAGQKQLNPNTQQPNHANTQHPGGHGQKQTGTYITTHSMSGYDRIEVKGGDFSMKGKNITVWGAAYHNGALLSSRNNRTTNFLHVGVNTYKISQGSGESRRAKQARNKEKQKNRRAMKKAKSKVEVKAETGNEVVVKRETESGGGVKIKTEKGDDVMIKLERDTEPDFKIKTENGD